MTGMMQVPRSRGALSGVLLVLLGIWGALVAFIGPYFHYAFTPNVTWHYTTDRLWLEILPGAAAIVGGLILLVTTHRALAMLGAWLAALSGAWFALGRALSPLWTAGGVTAGGTPAGTTTLTRVVEGIGFFTGLGVVMVFLAAMALGRLTVIGRREALPAAEPAAAAEPQAGDIADAETQETPVT
jgi:hypothetical protein